MESVALSFHLTGHRIWFGWRETGKCDACRDLNRACCGALGPKWNVYITSVPQGWPHKQKNLHFACAKFNCSRISIKTLPCIYHVSELQSYPPIYTWPRQPLPSISSFLVCLCWGSTGEKGVLIEMLTYNLWTSTHLFLTHNCKRRGWWKCECIILQSQRQPWLGWGV